MSEKRFTLDDEENGLCRCILVDGEEIPTCEICDLLNKLYEENEQLKKKNQRVYAIIENGGVLLTEKQLLDVIGEDKCDMFLREQATISALKEENEQLKKEHKIAIDEMMIDYKNLEKENRQMAEKLFILNEKYGL